MPAERTLAPVLAVVLASPLAGDPRSGNSCPEITIWRSRSGLSSIPFLAPIPGFASSFSGCNALQSISTSRRTMNYRSLKKAEERQKEALPPPPRFRPKPQNPQGLSAKNPFFPIKTKDLDRFLNGCTQGRYSQVDASASAGVPSDMSSSLGWRKWRPSMNLYGYRYSGTALTFQKPQNTRGNSLHRDDGFLFCSVHATEIVIDQQAYRHLRRYYLRFGQVPRAIPGFSPRTAHPREGWDAGTIVRVAFPMLLESLAHHPWRAMHGEGVRTKRRTP
jgi:hypothetical protein